MRQNDSTVFPGPEGEASVYPDSFFKHDRSRPLHDPAIPPHEAGEVVGAGRKLFKMEVPGAVRLGGPPVGQRAWIRGAEMLVLHDFMVEPFRGIARNRLQNDLFAAAP